MVASDPVFPGLDPERAQVARELFEYLAYPEGPMGETVIAHSFRAAIAFHLARLDVRIGDEPLIRKRAINGKGVFEDACCWVPVDMSDDEYDAIIRRRAQSLRERRPASEYANGWVQKNKITVVEPDE